MVYLFTYFSNSFMLLLSSFFLPICVVDNAYKWIPQYFKLSVAFIKNILFFIFSSWLGIDSTSVVYRPIASVLLGSLLERWNLRPTPGLLNYNLHFIWQHSQMMHVHVKFEKHWFRRIQCYFFFNLLTFSPINRFLDLSGPWFFTFIYFSLCEFSRWNVSRIPTISLGGATMMEMKELIERPSVSSLTNILDKQKFQSKNGILEFYNITELGRIMKYFKFQILQ